MRGAVGKEVDFLACFLAIWFWFWLIIQPTIAVITPQGIKTQENIKK